MSLVGPNGQPVGQEITQYQIDDFGIGSPKPPQFFLQQALQLAFQTVRQQDPIAASKIQNPFQMEPGAQAVFMMAAKKFAELDERIASLEAKLAEASSGDRSESSL